MKNKINITKTLINTISGWYKKHNILGGWLLINILLYTIGSFIALNINPFEWRLFEGGVGRVVAVVVELVLVAVVAEEEVEF